MKFVPFITTVAPTAAPVGVKPVIVGVASTLKFEALCTVTPLTVTEIFPEVALTGTIAVMLVAEEAVTVAVVVLNFTTLSAGVVLKFVPEITIVAPTAPLPGVNPEIEGEGKTVKSVALNIVTPLVVTDIGPVVAPLGTVVVMLVALAADTVAATPSKDTEGEALKLVPVIITVAPTAASEGLKAEIAGTGSTVKFEVLCTVIPLEVTAILPVVAPAGTLAVMLEAPEDKIVAVTPLKVTTGAAPKLVPLIVIVAPGAPLAGVNPVITGVASTEKLLPLEIVTPFTVIEIGPVEAPAGT